MKKHDIYQQILDIAESLTQTKGYNAFSYKDISALVGVKTSSIHYYFPTKADLGKAVVKKHIDSLCDELEQLINNKKLSCKKKLELFVDGIMHQLYKKNAHGLFKMNPKVAVLSAVAVECFGYANEDFLKRNIS